MTGEHALSGRRPLVSAVMPTADRRRFVPQAVSDFLGQTYPEKELIILDDGDPVRDLIPPDPRIRYHHLPQRGCYGEKINDCCRLAVGSIICHWDDDDWCAPSRLQQQVELLLRSGKAMAGYHCAFCFDERDSRAYLFGGGKDWALGASLCYFKSYWQEHPMLALQLGADNYMIAQAESLNLLVSVEAQDQMVVRIHGQNTSPKFTSSPAYREVPVTTLPQAFRDLGVGPQYLF